MLEMWGSRPAPAEQLATTGRNYVKLYSEEHVRRCGPAMSDTARAIARQGESAVQTAEELSEAVDALQEHSQVGAPALSRMLAQLRRVTQGPQQQPPQQHLATTTSSQTRGAAAAAAAVPPRSTIISTPPTTTTT
ncbi:hypothetical protein VOLCADRAFT_98855 [Volvox carteri f. nagariensis]|uniref:Uncharacterized protein n=1 Tax=Volvox carteri f. nagariensis TaxID=3068 RepID=D8UGG3_VOLCA|nr:uncharacterized protein VOLCADRAFT_98855 [Volvox carteri f. nagariensis]EFJ41194.1 hypothetical protein VOLCADRAFT_98855 [Volvox carteri f. nagariensis]|eukprot:XP_002957762.1 hypothetical protein VOLCADRAFT_98855 [Volvox carteri f. nagariensis]